MTQKRLQRGFILWITLVWFIAIAVFQLYLMRTEQLSTLLLETLCLHEDKFGCHYQIK